MERIVYFLVFSFISFMIYNILNVHKRISKNKKLIKMVSYFEDYDSFNKEYNDFIYKIKDDEFEAKAKAVKLWHIIYNDEFDKVVEHAKTINFKALTLKKNSIELNEDSLYYYLLASVNRLYSKGRLDLIRELEHIINIKEDISNTLIYKIYLESLKLYFNEDDKGEKFFKEVLDGNYANYKYSKILIGLYKNIITVLLAKIYIDREDINSFNLIKDDFIEYSKTVIGGRYSKELKLDYLKEVEE